MIFPEYHYGKFENNQLFYCVKKRAKFFNNFSIKKDFRCCMQKADEFSIFEFVSF